MIYVGLKVRKSGETHKFELVEHICESYCAEGGLCVSVSPTEYIYKGGQEVGAIIGIINYPRFPSSQRRITRQALELAKECLRACRQCRVSVETPHRTYMLTDTERVQDGK